jgi:hypothetical protein
MNGTQCIAIGELRGFTLRSLDFHRHRNLFPDFHLIFLFSLSGMVAWLTIAGEVSFLRRAWNMFVLLISEIVKVNVTLRRKTTALTNSPQIH